MKLKIISISLLCLWIFQCTCSYLIYQVGRTECHLQNFTENTSSESKKHSYSFVFQHEEQINWETKDKEIEKDGKLYDVVSIKHTEAGVVVTCVSDTKEDLIVDNYQSQLKEKSKQNHHKNSIKKTIELTYNEEKDLFKNNPSSCLKTSFNENQSFISSVFIDVKSPPPKV